METNQLVRTEVREAGQVVIDFSFPEWLPHEIRDEILEHVREEIGDCVTGAVMDVCISHGPKWDIKKAE